LIALDAGVQLTGVIIFYAQVTWHWLVERRISGSSPAAVPRLTITVAIVKLNTEIFVWPEISDRVMCDVTVKESWG
jgi:hypothetical protein